MVEINALTCFLAQLMCAYLILVSSCCITLKALLSANDNNLYNICIKFSLICRLIKPDVSYKSLIYIHTGYKMNNNGDFRYRGDSYCIDNSALGFFSSMKH